MDVLVKYVADFYRVTNNFLFMYEELINVGDSVSSKGSATALSGDTLHLFLSH